MNQEYHFPNVGFVRQAFFLYRVRFLPVYTYDMLNTLTMDSSTVTPKLFFSLSDFESRETASFPPINPFKERSVSSYSEKDMCVFFLPRKLAIKVECWGKKLWSLIVESVRQMCR